MKNLSIAAVLISVFVSGCAYVTSERVEAGDKKVQGLRYYDVKPILIVSGGTATISYIPDPTKENALRFGAFLAKNDMLVTLKENGTLVSIKSNQDATAPVDGLLQIANQIVASKLPTATTASSSPAGSGDVRVFDFVFGQDGTLKTLKQIKHIPLGKVNSSVVTPAKSGQADPDVTQPSDQS